MPPAGCVPHRSRVLVEPRQPRAHRDGDGATLTSFHTGFTLFLITFVFFFTPVGSNAHGSDGNGPKIQLPPPLMCVGGNSRGGERLPGAGSAQTLRTGWALGLPHEPQENPRQSSRCAVPQFPHSRAGRRLCLPLKMLWGEIFGLESTTGSGTAPRCTSILPQPGPRAPTPHGTGLKILGSTRGVAQTPPGGEGRDDATPSCPHGARRQRLSAAQHRKPAVPPAQTRSLGFTPNPRDGREPRGRGRGRAGEQ